MKPENVLLDDNMRIKITDFGTAKILDENDTGKWEPFGVGSDTPDLESQVAERLLSLARLVISALNC